MRLTGKRRIAVAATGAVAAIAVTAQVMPSAFGTEDTSGATAGAVAGGGGAGRRGAARGAIRAPGPGGGPPPRARG
ncbi:hypothetical protein ACFVZS_12260, partial [Streptomyces abikoensis]